MRFGQLVKGKRATRPVEFSIWGEVARCAVRPMTGLEEAEAAAAGRAYAVSKGISDPKPTDRVYEIGVMAHTLAIACVDVENVDVLYFASAQEVLENLDTDRITFLYESQQYWQDECSPLAKSMTQEQWAATTLEIVRSAEGTDPLARMRPVLRASYIRTTANQLWTSLTVSSTGFFPSEDEAKSSSPSTPRSEG